jgi:DNA modification methylase
MKRKDRRYMSPTRSGDPGAQTKGQATIVRGDAITEIAKLPTHSIDCIITSPPYPDT